MLSLLSRCFTFLAITILGISSGLNHLKKINPYSYAAVISATFAIAAVILKTIFVGAFSIDILDKPLDAIILLVHFHIVYCSIYVVIGNYKESLKREQEAKLLNEVYEEAIQQASRITGRPMEKMKLDFNFKRSRITITTLFAIVIVTNLYSGILGIIRLF